MVFSSLTFLYIFLPSVLLFYYIGKSKKYRNGVLLLFSLLFYAWGEPVYVLLMLLSILVNYFLGLLIKNNENKKIQKSFFIFALFFNLSYLLIFKYTDFLIFNINRFSSLNFPLLGIQLPIGISFYTFQIMSYIIDVYRNKVEVQKNIISLGLYISLFPQLIAGPIVRYADIEKQLKDRQEKLDDILSGFRRFVLGLGKKVIIANQMALVADTIFNKDLSLLSTPVILFGGLAFTLQIYYDFSGYSDMAIGLGRMFGFHFLENFNYPYISKSITEYWQRWHISLGRWFRDYVYFPLGGSRVSKLKWLRNIFIVWFITGFWHGASWNYILWGLYFGFLLVLEKLIIKRFLIKLPSILQWCYAFSLIFLGKIIFRIESLSQIMVAFKNIFFYKSGSLIEFLLYNYDLIYTLPFFLFAIIGCTPLFYNYVLKYEKEDNYKGILYDLYIIFILFFSILILLNEGYNPFIYFQF